MTAFGGIGFCCCGDTPDVCDYNVVCSGYEFSGAIELTANGSDPNSCWAGTFTMVERSLVTFYGYDNDGVTLIEANIREGGGGCAGYNSVEPGNIIICGQADYGPGGIEDAECCDLVPNSSHVMGPLPGLGWSEVPVHVPLWRISITFTGTFATISASCIIYSGATWGGTSRPIGGIGSYQATFDGDDLVANAGPFTLPKTYDPEFCDEDFPETISIEFLEGTTAQDIVCVDPPVQCTPAIPYNNLVAEIGRSLGDPLRVCLDRVNRSRWWGIGIAECDGSSEPFALAIECVGEVWIVEFTNESGGSWSTTLGGTIPTAMSFGPLAVTLCGDSDSLSGIVSECPDGEDCCPPVICCDLDGEGDDSEIPFAIVGPFPASTTLVYDADNVAGAGWYGDIVVPGGCGGTIPIVFKCVDNAATLSIDGDECPVTLSCDPLSVIVDIDQYECSADTVVPCSHAVLGTNDGSVEDWPSTLNITGTSVGTISGTMDFSSAGLTYSSVSGEWTGTATFTMLCDGFNLVSNLSLRLYCSGGNFILQITDVGSGSTVETMTASSVDCDLPQLTFLSTGTSLDDCNNQDFQKQFVVTA